MTTLFVCGDVMLARGIDQILARPCDPTLHERYLEDARDYIELAERVSGAIPRGAPPDYPWGDALAMLDAAHPDARIINLETSITRANDWDREKGIHYRLSPDNASCLSAAHIDVCALANNHVLDWGPRGLIDTLGALDQRGIARCGAGRDLAEASRPAVIELGARGRIAVFSVGCGDAGVPSWWEASDHRAGVLTIAELDDDAAGRLGRLIEPWRADDTLVVLSIHWGDNWAFAVPPEQQRFAHRMIDDAGVHLVHGHSSHHVKGIEVYRGQPILYGCGDLLTDYEGIRGHEAYRGDLGLLYFATFDAARRLARLEMAPTRVHRFRLSQPSPAEVQWLASTLVRTGQPLGTSATLQDSRLELTW